MSSTAGVANDGCPYAGVEIKAQRDHKLTGYMSAMFIDGHIAQENRRNFSFRLCSPDDAEVSLMCDHHIVPIITYNRTYETQMILQYRIGKVLAIRTSLKKYSDHNNQQLKSQTAPEAQEARE